ncbi:MAG: hypothetical protein K2Z81_18460, partial [Cyanobacteria bacterium]|nr:hypothetical protein [Cyanobacteriota bacterium]
MTAILNRHAHVTDIPDVEYKLALDCIRLQQYGHALFHIGHALAANPTCAEYVELVTRIDQLHSDCLSAEQLNVSYFGVQFVRALLLARRHRYDDALKLVIEIAHSAGDYRFLEKGLEWLEPAQEVSAITSLSNMCGSVLHHLLHSDYSDNVAAQLPQWLYFVDRVAELQEFSDELLLYRYSCMQRHCGRLERALAIAQELHSKFPGYTSNLCLASCFSDAGDLKSTIKHYACASDANPREPAIFVDLGDALLQDMRFKEALRAYERAMELEPSNAWARASQLYCQLRHTGEFEFRHRLGELARAGNRRAEFLCRTGCRPFIDYLPSPLESTINIMRNYEEGLPDPYVITLGHLESPTALESARRYLARVSPSLTFEIRLSPDTKSKSFESPISTEKSFCDPWSMTFGTNWEIEIHQNYVPPPQA